MKYLSKSKTWSVLVNTDFQKYLTVTTILMASSNVIQFVLSLYTLSITGSALIFSTALSVTIFPRLLFSPISGVIGDRFNKKKIMTSSCLLLGLACLLIVSLYSVNAVSSVFLVFSLIIMFEVFEVFFGAVSSAILPSIFKNEEALGKANTISSIDDEIFELISPLLGGAIYAIFNVESILIGFVVLLLICSLMCYRMKVNTYPEEITVKASITADFISGLKYVKKNELLVYLVVICSLANFVIVPSFSISLIYLFNNILGISSGLMGGYLSFISFFGLISSLLLTKYYPKKNTLFIIFISEMFITCMFCLLMISYHTVEKNQFIWIVLCVFGLIVSAATVFNILLVTHVQSITDNKFMSRTITIINLFATITIPLGQILFGVLIEKVDFSSTLIISFIIFIGISYISFRAYRLEEIQNEGK